MDTPAALSIILRPLIAATLLAFVALLSKIILRFISNGPVKKLLLRRLW